MSLIYELVKGDTMDEQYEKWIDELSDEAPEWKANPTTPAAACYIGAVLPDSKSPTPQ